jgi:transketolase
MANSPHFANAIRVLSMDAVQKANSGHPGMPMGMADIATVLWREFLRHNPKSPSWVNRDRFVLSNGHGSMLLYALLHLSGYALSMDDIKAFRQLNSKTPGHPEHAHTPGVETTTGPLGQGLANAVGMAIAERCLAAEFNRSDCTLIDHHTYVFAGDGCLMEGVSHEACSLAGTLGLGKLIVFWDDNGISIDGEVDAWFNEDTASRFEAYHWQVIRHVDGHNPEAIRQAIESARAETNKPTLICCKTIIGYGSPNLAGSEQTHGAPLGDSEIALVRKQLNWSHDPFEIPENIYQGFDATEKGAAQESAWNTLWNTYQQRYPDDAKEFQRRQQGQLPEALTGQFDEQLLAWQDKQPAMATRKASQQALALMGPMLPELFGGSADLTGSNLTLWSKDAPFSKDTAVGKYLYYGVREFGMGAIMNGIALHGAFIPYGGTFLTFLDYMRNAVRMAALMKQRVVFVFTHDSIGLGEDGPTHQPIEHLAMLRATPNVATWRPADAVETLAAWQFALTFQDGPTCLALSRQNCPQLKRTAAQIRAIKTGGYVLVEGSEKPDLIIMATGSEVALAMQVASTLKDTKGQSVRVVSMPCVEAFLKQPAAYQESVLPASCQRRVAIEAGSSQSWYRLVGHQGRVIGMDTFGLSAPAPELFDYYGFSVEKIIALL